MAGRVLHMEIGLVKAGMLADLIGQARLGDRDATFEVGTLGVPLRITEIMYNPPGGSVHEFIELQNVGISGYTAGQILAEQVPQILRNAASIGIETACDPDARSSPPNQ